MTMTDDETERAHLAADCGFEMMATFITGHQADAAELFDSLAAPLDRVCALNFLGKTARQLYRKFPHPPQITLVDCSGHARNAALVQQAQTFATRYLDAPDTPMMLALEHDSVLAGVFTGIAAMLALAMHRGDPVAAASWCRSGIGQR